MFSYEFYKILHLLSIILLASSVGYGFATDAPSRCSKIVAGITSLLVFVAGMGLIARIGISHTESWPHWIVAKIIFWLLLSILIPIFNKRLRGKKRKRGFLILMGLMGLLSYIGVYKPL